jgi:transcription termination factor Rho
MPVMDQDALAQSPLADLHAIASELGIDGYRRLRKADLIEAIVARQTGDGDGGDAAEDTPRPKRRRRRSADPDAAGHEPAAEAVAEEEAPKPRRRRRRTAAAEEAPAAGSAPRPGRSRDRDAEEEDAETPPRRRRSRSAQDDGGEDGDGATARPRRGRSRAARDEERAAEPAGGREEPAGEPAGGRGEDQVVEGVVELLSNGSGFVRVAHPEPSEEDVYVSAAQVRRCDLVSGDRVSGPMRPPRRSERYPSLARIETINGQPADQAAEVTRFEDMAATFPTERLELDSGDETVKAIAWMTPIGLGSRVTIAGPARAGKTEALRRIAAALAGREGIELSVVLAGARPEEVTGWRETGIEPATASALGAAPDQAAVDVERVVDRARRIAARGENAVVLIDTLDALPEAWARRSLATARNLSDGGSLTVIATATTPLGGETTVIALDALMTAARNFPAIDLRRSGTLRPELLVGEKGAQAIVKAVVKASK